MAQIKQLNLFIERSSYTIGSVCSVHYDYYIVFDKSELAQETKFQLHVEMWGIDAISEKRLTDETYDVHQFIAKHSMDISRSFVVPCHLLNERVGEDDIFINLVLSQGDKIIDQRRSDEIHDRF